MHVLFSVCNFIKSLFFIVQANTYEDEEYNLFLLTLLCLGFVFVGICMLIGIIIALFFLLILFGLITLGTLSISVMVGIHKQSFTRGFKFFVLVFSSILFSILGLFSFWVLNRTVYWWSEFQAIVIGGVIGLVSGLCTGFVLLYVIRKLLAVLKLKLEQRKSNRINGIS